MKFPKELTSVTTFSKVLALTLFIVLPFGGFYLGRQYQKSVDQYIYQTPQFQTITDPSEKPVNIDQASWKEFKDPSGKYSFNFPNNWLISFEQSPYYKDKMDVIIGGPEGKVEILWADSYGGACSDPGYEKIIIKSGEESICHAANITGEDIPDNTEFWQLQKQFKPNKPEGIYLNAYSYNNSEVLLQIIKSLNITAK
jgi:hypothetical protein